MQTVLRNIFIISMCGAKFVAKHAKMYAFLVDGYVRNPFRFTFTVSNTTIAGTERRLFEWGVILWKKCIYIIKASELAKVLYRSFIVSNRCISLRDEIAKEEGFPVRSNTGLPLVLITMNTLKYRRTAPNRALIKTILGVCNNTEIASSIVESIVIYVIYLLSWWRIGNNSMHENTGFSIFSVGVSGRMESPIPLTKPLIIGVVNNGNLTTAECDFFGHKNLPANVSWRSCLGNAADCREAYTTITGYTPTNKQQSLDTRKYSISGLKSQGVNNYGGT